ncbi:hypothetical protein [Lewinella sp. W8]|nr:hypothetical protein [Lewinella sp. W8]MTB51916.1 hypothetical protein [Lewinella sp. W8]
MTTEQLQELADHLDYVEIHAGMIRQHLDAVEKYFSRWLKIFLELGVRI